MSYPFEQSSGLLLLEAFDLKDWLQLSIPEREDIQKRIKEEYKDLLDTFFEQYPCGNIAIDAEGNIIRKSQELSPEWDINTLIEEQGVPIFVFSGSFEDGDISLEN